MFYSHDLLGRKTPLGAIWKLAHGSKLSKGKIISIDLREICQEILQPGVPHSLRLDAILIGGLVIVFNKQQAYLLEDLQEMMRKVKAAGKGAAAGGDSAGTSKTAGDKNTLKKGRNQAKLEAITMLDMEDLLAPMADDPLLLALGAAGDDDLALLRPGGSGLNFSLHGSGSGTTASVAEGLFLMPSLHTVSEAAGTGAAAGRDQEGEEVGQPATRSHERSGGVSWATGGGEQAAGARKGGRGWQQGLKEQQEDAYGGLAHGAGAWLHQDEMFDVNYDLDQFDLLGGMDLGPGPAAAAAAAASGPSKSKSATTATTATTATEQLQDGSKPAATTPASSELAGIDHQQQQQDLTLLPPEADPFALGDTEFGQHIFDQDFDQPLGEIGFDLQGSAPAACGSVSESKSEGGSRLHAEQQSMQEDHEEEDASGAAKAAVRKSKKRKASALIIDGLDNLQIRSKVYRDWVNDTSALINHNLLKGTARARGLQAGLAGDLSGTYAAAGASSLASLAAHGASGLSSPSLGLSRAVRTSLGLSGPSGPSGLQPAALFADPMPLYARLGLGPGAGGVGLCPELQELFRAPVETAAAAAEQRKAAKKARAAQPSSPQVNNSTGIGGLPGPLHQQVHRGQLHLARITLPGGLAAVSEGQEGQEVQGLDPGLMMMPEVSEVDMEVEMEQGLEVQQQQEALSNDEAHDQLMELPFADVEVERLRDAGAPSSPASGSLRISSPHRGAAAGAAGPGARRAESGTSGSSMLQRDLQYEGPEIDSVGGAAAGGGGLRRKLRLNSGDLGQLGGLVLLQGGQPDCMYFDGGRLDDLLPDVPLPEEDQLGETQDDEDASAAAVVASRGTDIGTGRFGSGLASLPSSQFPLLEETEGQEATQLQPQQQQGQQAGVMTQASRKVLSIFHERLQPAAAGEEEDAGGEEGAQPSLSLFGLMREGRLARSAAAMLFYQVCVISSAGYIAASQKRPFGDIIIKPGRVAL